MEGDISAVSDSTELAEFGAMLFETASDPRYIPPAALRAACSAQQPTASGFDMFPSDAALTDALVGTWILCGSESTRAVAHAGIRIAADGSWTHIEAATGAAIELRGFGHEGDSEVIDTSDINESNVRQFNLSGVPQEFGFSSDRQTLRLALPAASPPHPRYDNLYVRTALPVGPPRLLRAAGERAGAAACPEGEAFVRGFSTEAELRAGIVGTWAIAAAAFDPGRPRWRSPPRAAIGISMHAVRRSRPVATTCASSPIYRVGRRST